ncbi:hypothetical protein HanXRQr2_Chr14g0624241 [Helianthus annuus]|uniref:Secreted protein n=1 Tax=Helianthus annuus TaxID=4232 RepID=A0A9K3H627_HELAN|nr:hypothetical protein HanXRQr2_Chr14g0624241 [Helianthus annuus]KAJ0838800.1 hypothetical protein HanPSC8_Chr14g0599091 [Helianthus annuus]
MLLFLFWFMFDISHTIQPFRYLPHSLVNRKPPEKNLQVRRNYATSPEPTGLFSARITVSFSWIFPIFTRTYFKESPNATNVNC